MVYLSNKLFKSYELEKHIVKSLDLIIEPDQSTWDDDMKDEYDNLIVKEEADLLMVEEGY